jgi:tetratricopeptide (TPR) repeat protein
MEHEARGDLEKAYAMFWDALDYDSGNKVYAEAAERTGEKLVDEYHRKAMDYYNRQQMSEAKVYWKKILEVDPDNSIAPGYLSKVEKVQKGIRESDGN